MADQVEIEGLAGTLRALDRLPDVLDRLAGDAGEASARDEVPRIKGRAARVGRVQALAARSVRVQGGRLVGAAGGGVPAAIFYGAEFGGGNKPTTRQFDPFRGQRGYWFWPQLRDDEGRIVSAYSDALDDLEQEWTR